MGNTSESDKTTKEIEKLNAKIEKMENKNAVLEDKVKSYEDPASKPRIISKGFTNKEIKFQKNQIRVNGTTGEVINPKLPAK